MKAMIIYVSQTGFTEKYAKWLAEELGGSCVPYKERGKVRLEDYDVLVFGGWLHAGKVRNLKWFQEQTAALKGKRLAVFAVGAAPTEGQSMEKLRDDNLTKEEQARIGFFYLPGGMCYEKMGTASKLMMKMFSSMMSKKKDKTPQEEEMARMIGSSYDISGRGYLKELEEFLLSGK